MKDLMHLYPCLTLAIMMILSTSAQSDTLLAIALSMPLRYAIAESDAWLSVAKWIVKQF